MRLNLSVCTISFRHQLIALSDIATWAQKHGFTGIELWGAHAINLEPEDQFDAAWLGSLGLEVPMISDYLPLEGAEIRALRHLERLCRLANRWEAPKLRTFAGNRGSAVVTREERKVWVARLRNLASLAAAHGVQLVVETHPNTLADTLASTCQLLEEVDHPAMGINFDVLHVWEAGDDPLESLRVLESQVCHFHLKNIDKRENLGVFAPANVYAAAGSRDGMVPLLEGAFDYRTFLQSLGFMGQQDASLEWFGPDVKNVLARDCRDISVLTGNPHPAMQAKDPYPSIAV